MPFWWPIPLIPLWVYLVGTQTGTNKRWAPKSLLFRQVHPCRFQAPTFRPPRLGPAEQQQTQRFRVVRVAVFSGRSAEVWPKSCGPWMRVNFGGTCSEAGTFTTTSRPSNLQALRPSISQSLHEEGKGHQNRHEASEGSMGEP